MSTASAVLELVREVSAPLQTASSQFQISRYLGVASLTLCTWDWLLAIADEFTMVRKNKRSLFSMVDVVYFVSRTFPIAYLISCVIVGADPEGTCEIVARIKATLNMFMVPAISLLFFFRVNAVYLHNKFVVALFGILWLVLLGSFVYDSATIFAGYVHVDDERNCSLAGRTSKSWLTDALACIVTAVFDTCIYIAISWRLACISMAGRNWKDRIKSFTTGDGMLTLSRVLLRSGQLYYFATIGTNALTAMMTMAPNIPEASRGLLIMPSVAIQSVMACKLFRELKIGLIVDPTATITSVTSTMEFSSSAGGPAFIELEELGFNALGCTTEGDRMDPSGVQKDSGDLKSMDPGLEAL